MTIVERHRMTPFEYVDVEVQITDEGDVVVRFESADGPYFQVSVDQLADIVDFAELHGQVTVRPQVVSGG